MNRLHTILIDFIKNNVMSYKGTKTCGAVGASLPKPPWDSVSAPNLFLDVRRKHDERWYEVGW